MFSGQSLRRSAPAPFAQGSHESVRFSALCHRESKGEIQDFNTEAAGKRKSRTLPQSLRDSSLSEGAFVCACFFLCATEKIRRKFKALEPKVCTFAFCGSAVGHYVPSSGRKVSRGSVTEGACGTEGGRKFLFCLSAASESDFVSDFR